MKPIAKPRLPEEPRPNLKQMKPSSSLASAYLALPAALATVGTWLSTLQNTWLWLTGQVLLALFFFQCFVLLHETGHNSFFASKRLNRLFGHIFGFLSFIPFESWTAIHHLHHRWTGWRDKDPTTESTVSPRFGKVVRAIVNFSWKVGLPLFTIGYRLANYWSPAKLRKYLPAHKLRTIRLNQLVMLACYAALFLIWGKWIVLHFGLAYLLSLAISDIIILSQHSHIEIPVSEGQEVKPISYLAQIPYSRSLQLNRFLARYLLFNFNLHELHHAHPGVPAYHLDQLPQNTPNSRPFWAYLVKAKQLSGVSFVFSTSKKSGVEV